jgi:hypothetical protein
LRGAEALWWLIGQFGLWVCVCKTALWVGGNTSSGPVKGRKSVIPTNETKVRFVAELF